MLHPHAGGATGTGHGADFRIVDVDNVVLNAAKAMAMTTIDLLDDSAAEANRVTSEFQPKLDRAGYLEALRRLAYERTYSD